MSHGHTDAPTCTLNSPGQVEAPMTEGPNIPVLVFAGPSISASEVSALLPRAELRPPIRRGDLYTARMLRHSVFVILDGVFFQDHAVAPREVLDVLQDGAVVVGAASIGALRAAECWPAGMVGVGLIYRLFRAGLLDSDDEVAVGVAGAHGHKGNSVPLVNMRYALSRCSRAGVVPRAAASALLTAALETFYTERHWPTVFRRAGLGAHLEDWLPALQSWDLKRLDAARALRHTAEFLRLDGAGGVRVRATSAPLLPNDLRRERCADALQGEDPRRLQRRLFEHLRDTGELPNHLPMLRQRLRLPGVGSGESCDTQSSDQRDTLEQLAACALWDGLEASGQLASQVFHLRACEEAVQLARGLGVEPGVLELSLAETALSCRRTPVGGSADPLERAVLSSKPWTQTVREQARTRSVKRWLFQSPRWSCPALRVPPGGGR